jgi:FMN phosphatase YigB (HAD superfamily)
MKMKKSLLILDFDNTLYDWVNMWHTSFNVLLDIVINMTKINKYIIEKDIQGIFQERGTTEYTKVMLDLFITNPKYRKINYLAGILKATKLFREKKISNITLYPNVLETLRNIESTGCKIILFTESMEQYTTPRIKSLDLDGIIPFIFTTTNSNNDWTGYFPLYRSKVFHLPDGDKKPDPNVLLDIIKTVDSSISLEQVVYVGDSLMKDIAMAQSANVTDIYAKYGMSQNTDAYEQLRRVTHWTKDAVEEEKRIYSKGKIEPTFTLEKSFADITQYISFSSKGG